LNIQKTIKRNKFLSILIALGIPVLIFESGSISKRMEMSSKLKDKIERANYEAMTLKISKHDAERKAAIAKSRYLNGCSIPVLRKDKTQYVSVVEGMTVFGTNNKPLAIGTQICDQDGNTGVMITVNGKSVVGDIAFTGEWGIIKAKRKYNVVAGAD
jgi:hypothetical protein